MSQATAQASAGSLIVRAGVLLALGALMFLVPASVSDPSLRQVIPYFAVLLFLHAAPALFTRGQDLFAPPIFHGVRALFSTLGTLLSFVLIDELRLDMLELTDPTEVARAAERALLASIVGVSSMYVGYYVPLGRGLTNLFPRVAGIAWTRGRLLVVCALPAAVFLVAYTVFQLRVGVSLFDFTQLRAGKAVWRDTPMLSWMMRGIELGFLPLLFLVARRALDPRRFALLLPLVAAIVCGLLVTRLGQRGPFANAMLAGFLIVHYLRRRVPVWAFVVVMIAGMAVSNVLHEWRLADPETPRREAIENLATNPVLVLAAHESERQRFGALALVIDAFPDKVPYLAGESWISLIAAPIPRWLWPEKVEHFPWQDNRIVFQLSGVPAPTPFVGVLYANLSWIGVIVGMFFMGVFYRALYEWLRRHPRDPNVVLLYAPMLIFFEPTFLGLSAMMQYLFPVWLMIAAIGLLGRERDGGPRHLTA